MKRHIKFSEEEKALLLLDQRYLPLEEKWFVCRKVRDAIFAMQEMVVRGAPAIGVTAAYACCIALEELDPEEKDWPKRLREKLNDIENARPTAVNLSYAVNRMRKAWKADPDLSIDDLRWVWGKMAKELLTEDIAGNKAMGKAGAALLKDGARVMTHCNAGALATGGYGTALGVFRAAKSEGKKIQVLVNETRPLLQGARLTAYELFNDEIDVRLVCDNSAGVLMAKKMVDAIVVGADRIAANGDTANKVGTYSLAVLAQAHGVPFYVAAPSCTFDLNIVTGQDIPIEQREEAEVTHLQGKRIAPAGVQAYNFAFDVTPNKLIHAFITEKGLLKPPFQDSIQNTLSNFFE